MNKLNGLSQDIQADNICRIKELFPNVVVEGKINFDMLRTVLGDEIDVSKERYQFVWNGKTESIKLAQAPSSSTLRPCKEKSINWETTGNYIRSKLINYKKQIQILREDSIAIGSI